MNKTVKKASIFSAITMALASVVCGVTMLQTPDVQAETTATYTEGATQTSANLQSLDISSFSCLEDFTKYFTLGYGGNGVYATAGKTLADYASYSETNQSININNTFGSGLDIRFHTQSDGTIGSGYYGKTQLGNFEIKMTLKGVDVTANEHVYFSSRIEWDSSLASGMKLQTSLTCNTDGEYGLGTNGASYVTTQHGNTIGASAVSEGFTITVGYVNNYMYFYYGDAETNGYSIAKNTISKCSNTSRDGNQTFAIYLLNNANIEISAFSYRRLESEFSFDETEENTYNMIIRDLEGYNENVDVDWAVDGDLTSSNLNGLKITEFTGTEFTDWFKITNSGLTVSEYVTYNESGSVTVGGTGAVSFRLLPFNSYGNAKLGNFEVKITLNSASGNHVYMGSRRNWATNSLQDSGARVILNGGKTVTTWGTATAVKTGANGKSFTSGTITVGFIDNCFYYYVGEKPSTGLTNCSVYYKTYDGADGGSITHENNGTQIFEILLLAGAKIEIADFSYERLDAEKYPFQADTITDGANSVDTVLEYLNDKQACKEAVFSEGGYNSQYLQSANVETMTDVSSFSDYFKLAYNARIGTIPSSTLEYNETNQSVKIVVPDDQDNSTDFTEWRFMPQETYDCSYLGNYEMSVTIKADATQVLANRNFYFGNYLTTDSVNYSWSTVQFRAVGGVVSGEGVWTIGSKMYKAADTLKVTIGYVNGYSYYYVNDEIETLVYTQKVQTLTKNGTDNRDGNQCFAIAIAENTPIEICAFSYERLDKEFSFTADGTEEAYINARMEQKAINAQAFEMMNGASVRLADPTGLRFGASFAESYVTAWTEKGYTVKLGMMIAPTQYITAKKGALTLENENYTAGKDYQTIAVDYTECSLMNGSYRINGVLTVKEANYGVNFTGVGYLQICDVEGNVVYTKYATANDNDRSIQYVAKEALNDTTKTYTEKQITILNKLAGNTTDGTETEGDTVTE